MFTLPKLTIHQPEYLPWLGFFKKVKKADIHVFGDNVQFEKKGFQNRNRIQAKTKPWKWLTIPVKQVSYQKIKNVEFANNQWAIKHRNILREIYKKDFLGFFYKKNNWKGLNEVNQKLTKFFFRILNIKPKIYLMSELGVSKGKTEGIIEICKKLGIKHYISGQGAKNYLDIKKLSENNIKVTFSKYKDLNTPPLSIVHYFYTQTISKIKTILNS